MEYSSFEYTLDRIKRLEREVIQLEEELRQGIELMFYAYRDFTFESDQQLKLATAAGDSVGISAAVQNIGLVHWNQGDYAHALSFLQQALTTANEAGYQRGVIISSGNLAGLYAEQGDHTQGDPPVRAGGEAEQKQRHVTEADL